LGRRAALTAILVGATRACKPCVDVRGLAGAALDRRIKLGGMNEFHAAAKAADARVISY
jgi:tRNA 2-thiouridine synthesizing protein D